MEEVFQMQIRLSLRKGEREALLKRLQQAYARGELRLIKRIHALLYIIDGKTVAEVAEILKPPNHLQLHNCFCPKTA